MIDLQHPPFSAWRWPLTRSSKAALAKALQTYIGVFPIANKEVA